MICPKCGSSNIRIQVPVGVSAPAELEGKFSKGMFRRADVNLTHANWECLDHICVDCCYSSNGYGNYVSRLADDNTKLTERVDSLESENDALKTRLSAAEELLTKFYGAYIRVDTFISDSKDRKIEIAKLLGELESLGVNKASGIDWKRLNQ